MKKLYCGFFTISRDVFESALEALHDPRETEEEVNGLSERGFLGVTCTLERCPSSFCISSGIPNETELFCGVGRN